MQNTNNHRVMESTDSLPLRAINAHTFCPRLMWYEYVEGEFIDNHHTLEGSAVHRNVDKPGGELDAGEEEEPWHARSLWLSSDTLGINGKIDLVENLDDGSVMPVDTKKGKPNREGGLWPADRVQLVLQALLLMEHGFECNHVAAWYHGSRKRVVLELADEHVVEAREAIEQAYTVYRCSTPPEPLVDSPKCGGCSLAPVCLPDEHNALKCGSEPQEVPRVLVPRENQLPLYISEAGSRVGLKRRVLRIQPRPGSESEVVEVGLGKFNQLNLMGGVQITTQALQACMKRDIPVGFFSFGGFYYGRAHSTTSNKVGVRLAQYREHDSALGLQIAQTLIADKIHNGRVFLRRNGTGCDAAEKAVKTLKRIRGSAERAEDRQQLLGFEGEAARNYWAAYSQLMAMQDSKWTMKGRNRRPPRDPTNALLSYGYGLLVKDAQLAVEAAGLDAYLGIFHTAHHGRAAMALDLMEPFRRLIVDSVVYQMIRRAEVTPDDFVRTGEAVAMKQPARKALIRAYERRMSEEITHPFFGYTIAYRRILQVQARLLARTLTGELKEFPRFRTR